MTDPASQGVSVLQGRPCQACGVWNSIEHNRCWKCKDTLPPMREPPKPAKSLALCLPMYRDMTFETWDFVNRFRELTPPHGWHYPNLFPAKSTPVAYTRERIVEKVLETEKDLNIRHEVLLWVDSDNGLDDPQLFWDMAARLHAAPPAVGLLGVPCRMRGYIPTQPNFGCYTDAKGQVLDAHFDCGDGVALPTYPMRATVKRPFILVRRIGFGLVAMRRGVFDVLKKPWFSMDWNPSCGPEVMAKDRIVGEDAGFCDALRKAGMVSAADFSLARTAWHLFEEKKYLPREMTLDYDPEATWKEPA